MAQRRTKNNILRSATMSAAGDAKESCRSDGGASSGHVSPVRLPRPHSVAGRLPNYAMPTVASRIRICMSTDKLPDYNLLPTCCRYSRPVSPQLVFIKVKPRRSHSVDTTLSSPRRTVRSDVGSAPRSSRPGTRRERCGGLESPPHLFHPTTVAAMSHSGGGGGGGGGGAAAQLNPTHRTFSLRRPRPPPPTTDLDASLRSFTSKPVTTGVQNVPAIRFDKKSSMGSLDASTAAVNKTIISSASPVSKKSKIVSGNEGRSAFANISPRTTVPMLEKKGTSSSTAGGVVAIDTSNHPSVVAPANFSHGQPKHNESISQSTDAVGVMEGKNVTATESTRITRAQSSKVDLDASITSDNKLKQSATGINTVANHAASNHPSSASKVIVSPSSNSAAKATASTNKVLKPAAGGGTGKRSITPSAGLIENDVHVASTGRTSNGSGATNGPTTGSNTFNAPKTSSTISASSVTTHKVSSATTKVSGNTGSVNFPKGPGLTAVSSGKASTVAPGNTPPKVSSSVSNGASSKHASHAGGGQGVDTSKTPGGSAVGGVVKAAGVSSGGDANKPINSKSSNGSSDVTSATAANKTSASVSANRTNTPTSIDVTPVKDSSHKDSPTTASSGKTTPRPTTDPTTSPTKQEGVKQGVPSAPATSSAVPDAAVEEYRAKLAEKRRLARLRADNAAEEERIKQEQLKQAEEDRIRREEEEEARQEAEELRLAAEAAAAERERFLKLVEGEEKRKQEEADRIELEKQEKLEKERESKEEAERLEAERQAKIKRDEEEKNERKKRLESIMKRVKTEDSPSTKTDTVSAVPAPITPSISPSTSTIDDTPAKMENNDDVPAASVNGSISHSASSAETKDESKLVNVLDSSSSQSTVNDALTRTTTTEVADNIIQASDATNAISSTEIVISNPTGNVSLLSSFDSTTVLESNEDTKADVVKDGNDLLSSTFFESSSKRIPAGMDSPLQSASHTSNEINHTIVDANGVNSEQKSVDQQGHNDEHRSNEDKGNEEQSCDDVTNSIVDANGDKQRVERMDDVPMNLMDFAVKVTGMQST